MAEGHEPDGKWKKGHSGNPSGLTSNGDLPKTAWKKGQAGSPENLWKKGQSGNPKGRAPVEKERAYYDKTIASVSLADWGEVVRKAVYQAKRGDRYARRWLGDYLIGPAIQRLELEHRMSNNRLVEWINELFGEADAQVADVESETTDV